MHTRIPPNPCPECGALVDCADAARGDHAPTPEDVSLCLYCGAWLGFRADLTLRKLSDVEIEKLPADLFDILVRAGRARAEVMRGHPKAR